MMKEAKAGAGQGLTKGRAGIGGNKTLYGQLFGYLYIVGRSVMRKKLFAFFVLFVLLPVLSLVTGLLMYDLSFATGAKGELVIKSIEKYGLRVEHSDNPFMFKNLYPGYPSCPGEDDESPTVVKISNTGEKNFELLIEKKVLSDDVEELMLYNYEGLKMDVFERGGVDKKLFSGPLKELQKIEAGTVSPGAGAREFEFSISLDEGAGNELQGKSIELQWIFTATGATDEPDPPEPPGPPSDPSEPLGPSEPSSPLGPSDPSEPSGPSTPSPGEKKEEENGDGKQEDGEGEIIKPPDKPGQPPEEEISVPELPKTGEFPRAIYYGIGSFMILAGILLKKVSRI
jgi:hypothetical protein